MKTTILLFFLAIASCSKPDATKQEPVAQLPPETQTGANTFGVTINGKVYIPRDPTGNGGGLSNKAIIFWGAPGNNNEYNEIEIKDGASAIGFNMLIHMQNFNSLGIGKYILFDSNFHKSIDSISNNHIYFKIWDSKISNYTYYGSFSNLGELNITRASNGIISGNFKGKFVRYDNPNEFIDIKDGRFDINTTTLATTSFP